ncbi:DUF6753 family protein [cf. Phormidesmis sp. LEGE 11477]|uniref:DUF6753 family protein n=1 Tax=cf. Phormidesmis sp. LEGE 11477 TaxID=1828680 RepID=UPI001882B4BC|nr:DUF6753 family protein [cf. Phormidesmis sp. LEGE 11477]MBE9060336.1 hypothetical protein [cf. Phormidesmis sp. LEGE 11477]
MNDSSLDQLLKGRSQTFRDTVRALVQRYNIDENDPTFILLAGTSTLEVILERYPQELETLFGQLLSQLDNRWGVLQSEWASAAEKGLVATQQLTLAIESVKQVSKEEQETIRAQAGTQAKLLTRAYQEQSDQLRAEAEQLAGRAIASAQVTAAKQVEDISKKLRSAYQLQAAGIAFLGAAVLLVTGWTLGRFG